MKSFFQKPSSVIPSDLSGKSARFGQVIIARKVLVAMLIVLASFCDRGLLEAQTESPVSVESHVDKSTITIGDTLRYLVRLTRDPNVQVQWPSLASNLGAFEIRDYDKPEPRKRDDKVIEEVSYTISTFDTGRFVIPPLTIAYLAPPDTTWRTLATESLEIYVKSILPSEAGDIRDVKVPWELPRDWRQIILISVIAGAVLLLAGLGFYWWRKRQGKGFLPQRIEPPRPAHEIALEALRVLRESDLLARGEIKQFYIQLSEIFRGYLENRYGITALEMTTTELLAELRRLALNPENFENARALSEQSDLVKFAKLIPPVEESERLVSLVEAFVESTKVMPLVEVPPARVDQSKAQENVAVAAEVS